jgi:hypothetical protein
MFPGHAIYPLPNKKVGYRRFEDDFVKKRMVLLEKFMNIIMESEVYKSSEALIVFLNQKERDVFENKMKEYNNMSGPVYVEDMKSLTGKVEVADDPNEDKYFNNIANYLNIQSILLRKVNISLKNYHTHICNAYISLEEAEMNFSALAKLNKRVYMVIIFL